MRFHVLERFHQAQGLFHTATDWEIIDTQMLDDPIRIDDEETSVIEQRLRECKSCSKTQETRSAVSARQLLLDARSGGRRGNTAADW